MNKIARMIVQDKLSRRDSAGNMRGDQARGDNARGDMQNDRGDMRDRSRDYNAGYRDGYDQANYEIRGEYDREDGARRRSKTTGRYVRDRGESVKLGNHDLMHWEKNLRNADGTRGKHFDMSQVIEVANKLGIRFDEYSEKEFCMVMNMLYSDFCEVCRAHVSPEKEAHYYAKMAQAWLEDDDGPMPSEKLALYYYCIVDEDE